MSSCVVVTHTFQLKAKLSAANAKSFHKEVQSKNLEVLTAPSAQYHMGSETFFLQNVNRSSFSGVFLKFNYFSWVSWVHHYFDWHYLTCFAHTLFIEVQLSSMSENEWKRNEPEMVHFSGKSDESCDKIWSKWLSCVALASRRYIWPAFFLNFSLGPKVWPWENLWVSALMAAGLQYMWTGCTNKRVYYSCGGILAKCRGPWTALSSQFL